VIFWLHRSFINDNTAELECKYMIQIKVMRNIIQFWHMEVMLLQKNLSVIQLL